MKKKAVPAKTSNMPVHRAGRNTQVTSNLPIGHAANDLQNDEIIEVGALLPVGGGEGLATEGSPAVKTSKPLDTFWSGLSSEETGPFIFPIIRQMPVKNTFRVGTEGWIPVFSSRVHAQEGQNSS